MTEMARLHAWLTEPLEPDVVSSIERLRRAPQVARIAVMPDVHLSGEVCVGVVAATSGLLYPQAVGGDIGCGMLSVACGCGAAALRAPRVAGQLLADLATAVPARRRHRRATLPMPTELASTELSDAKLEKLRRDEGALEFGTLGGGNHFIELQADEEDRLWLTIHSGSRAVGPAIRDHHLARGQPVGGRLIAVDPGSGYAHDAEVARRYADGSRRAMADQVGEVLQRRLGARLQWETAITADHNHVQREHHDDGEWWVHRKGAMCLRAGEPGVLPGSMGTLSFHVEGRGSAEALHSSAHGAGRRLSRSEARAAVSDRDFCRQMGGVWFDPRLTARLRDEAPAAYKDVRAVVRAQRELVKVTRTLRPVLCYKGP